MDLGDSLTVDNVWVQTKEIGSSKPYVYNVATGKSAWEYPGRRWHRARDLASGREYFFNLRSQQASWARPEELELDDEEDDAGDTLPFVERFGEEGNSPLYSDWVPAFDPLSNKVYWYNPKLQKSQWNKPSDCKHPLTVPSDEPHHTRRLSTNVLSKFSSSDPSAGDAGAASGSGLADGSVFPSATKGTAVERLAKQLQSRIKAAAEENQKLKAVQRQLSAQAEARLRLVSDLRPAFRSEGGQTMAPGRMGRYLETSLQNKHRLSYRPAQTIKSFLKSVPLFHNLEESQFTVLQNALKKCTFEDGDVIVKQDTKGDSFFLIERGKVNIYCNDPIVLAAANASNNSIAVKNLKQATSSKASLQSGSRRGSGQSLSSTLTRSTKKTNRNQSLVSASSTGKKMLRKSSSKRNRRKSSSGSNSSRSGKTTGKVVYSVREDGSESDDEDVETESQVSGADTSSLGIGPNGLYDSPYGKVINELYAGDYFGERSVMTGQPRNATVVAVGQVTCLTLSKDIFSQVLSSSTVQLPNLNMSQANNEIKSLNKHITNFDTLITMRRKAANSREGAVAEALMQLMTAFSPELNVEDTIERMMKTLYIAFNCERVSLFYVDWENETMTLQISKESDMRSVVLPLGTGIVGHCANINKLVNVPDAKKNPHFFPDVDKKMDFITRTVLCIPVMGDKDKVIAVIQLINKRGGAPFSQDDEHVGISVAEQMALTLAHKKAELETDFGKVFCPIWRVPEEQKFNVRLKRFLGASLSTPTGVPNSDTVICSVMLFHGGEFMADVARFRQKAERTSPFLIVQFDHVMKLDISIRNLPRAARLIFKLQHPGDERVPDSQPTPIGWAGCNLFNFDQILFTGPLRLMLFPGDCTAELAMVTPLLNNTTKQDVDLLEVEFPDYEKPVIFTDHIEPDDDSKSKNTPTQYKHSKHTPNVTRATKSKLPEKSKNLNRMLREQLETFLHRDPLQKLNYDERLIILHSRRELSSNPEALPKYLLSVRWNKRSEIQEAYRLLNRWAVPDPIVALQLLDAKFPDPKVRALAIASLENLSDDQLRLYMLQLTQVIKFEPFIDNALARFLLRRALKSPDVIGHTFFWYLKAEIHIPEVRERYGAYLDMYLRHCGEYRTSLGHQMFVMNKLEHIADTIKSSSVRKADRNRVLQSELADCVFPERFQMPLDPSILLRGFNINHCRVMNSKKAPLNLELIPANPKDAKTVVLFKKGDDLRQDQLTLQVLKVMDQLWKAEGVGLDMCMSLYGCVATGDQTGMIEIVQNSLTLADITAGLVPSKKSSKKNKGSKEPGSSMERTKKGKGGLANKLKAVVNVYFDDEKLKRWLMSNGHPKKVVEQNFLHSCAAYCVATYVLGIGDRHNDNIMLCENGKLFHIDFGHFLGNFKSKLGFKREKAPFVFTPAMAAILGNPGKPLFKQFEQLCCKAYNVLRAHTNLLITLFSLMLSCGIPELKTAKDIEWMRERLLVGKTDEEASAIFLKEIESSLKTKTTQLNNAMHMLKHA